MTEVTAIAGTALYQPVLSDKSDYIVGKGSDGRVLMGGLSELLLVVAMIGTVATLYPVVKRHNPTVALGYLCSRLLEAAVITIGIVSVLSVVTLRQDLAGAAGTDDHSLAIVGRSLVAFHDWTFLVGPNFVLGANSLLLAYLMYRSRLVPQVIVWLGLIGGPLVFVSAIAVMFGLYEQLSPVGLIAGLPVFAWEVSLAIYLILKGFKPSPDTAPDTSPAEPHPELSPS
jgi:hypothetical protein